jgi:5'-nucleotidase
MPAHRVAAFALSSVLFSVIAACAGSDEDVGDADDEVRALGGLQEGSDEACAVLRVANEASGDELDHDVALDVRAADAIVRTRAGADATLGTGDDEWFATLAELDAAAYVGPKAFGQLRRYAKEHSAYACGVVDVQLLAFNDFHGNLQPPSGSGGRIVTGPSSEDIVLAGGAEYFATHVKQLEAENPNTVVVAAGDVIGATPLLSALFHDEPTIESMNALGLDVAAVGNHEFDRGPEELLRMQHGGCHPTEGCQAGDGFEGARFGYLAANVFEKGTGERILPPYTVRSFAGARVAFIGVTLEGTPLVTNPASVASLRFADEADTINALVPEIRRRGVETIVVLIHEGGFQTGRYDQCEGISGPLFEIVGRLDPAIDVVVSGHTNAAHVCNLDGRLVTSAASAGRIVTDIDLQIDARTGHAVSMKGRNVIASRDVEKDAEQTTIIEKYEALAAPLANRVVGSATADLLKATNAAGESTLGDVIADAQLAATRTTGGAAVAFMNPGGIRADLVHAQSSGGEVPGAITYGEAFTVQPFGNTLMTLTLTGAELHALLEQQWTMSNGEIREMILQVSEGFSYAWDPRQPVGSRVDPASMRIGGERVRAEASYRVTVNAFLADGGDGFSVLKSGTNRAPGGLDLDAFLAYLAKQSPLAPPPRTRITRL